MQVIDAKQQAVHPFYDVIIVGGGLVGAGLALALRDTALTVALIDARLPSNKDARLFALSNSSCQFLKNIGVWSALLPHVSPIHQVHVSNQGHFGAVRLQRTEVNLSELGFVVPAFQIETALNTALEQAADATNITVYRPARLETFRQHDNQVEVKLRIEDAELILQTHTLIGADGAESTVRAQLHLATKQHDYQQSALVTRTTLQRAHQQIAYERFYPQGAIAMLPLQHNECATIWSADNATIKHLMALSDLDFLQALQQEFGYRLGRFEKISQRHLYPLRMMCVENAAVNKVLLIGNAAHTLHPIAAQGFNLSIYEVAVLVDALLEKARAHQPCTAQDLQAVQQKIQQQQALSMGISHRLSTAFGTNSSLLACALQCGMVGLNMATPLKRKFIQRMIGKTGHIPRLLLSTMP